jgi:hypothetical protein
VTTRIATIVAGLALAVPALAAAERTAVGAQRVAIERAAGVAAKGLPQRCLRVEVTTESGGRWATVAYSGGNSRGCIRWAFNGVAIVQRAASGWRAVVAGSAGIACGHYRIPPAVRHDLHLPCRT